jgi:hypothetical protein
MGGSKAGAGQAVWQRLNPTSKTKRYKCKACGEICAKKYAKTPACNDVCAFNYAVNRADELSAKKARQAVAKDRRETKAKLDAIEKKSVLEKRAQKAVNDYVRARDAGIGCVTCDKPSNWHGQWHAGHYKSVGSNSYLRFNLWNIQKQCSVCNHHQSGNIGEYKERLPIRIGQEKFDWINAAPQLRRFERDYLIRLARVFNKKTRRMAKRAKTD